MKYDTHIKDILSELATIVRKGYSSYSVFEDWLDLMLLALMQNDPEYLKIVHTYENKGSMGSREIDCFAKAFGMLLNAMNEINDEILGELYMQWNMANKYKGQFFTPKSIASMMAHMLKPTGNILEPYCGAGIMLVETIKTMEPEEIEQSVLYGQDIDLTCVKMCALNLLFFNVNGYVIWGDTLKLEVKKVYQTRRSFMGGVIRELSEDEIHTFAETYQRALLEANLPKTFANEPTHSGTTPFHQQLQLF